MLNCLHSGERTSISDCRLGRLRATTERTPRKKASVLAMVYRRIVAQAALCCVVSACGRTEPEGPGQTITYTRRIASVVLGGRKGLMPKLRKEQTRSSAAERTGSRKPEAGNGKGQVRTHN